MLINISSDITNLIRVARISKHYREPGTNYVNISHESKTPMNQKL